MPPRLKHELFLYYPISIRFLIQKINYFFDDPKVIDGLMKGYREMGSLNRQISNDFSCCEQDADIHLTQYRQRLRNLQ